MKIFIAEYVCSGGLEPMLLASASGARLMREAQAMLQAVCEDASRCGQVITVLGTGVDVPLAAEVQVHRRRFDQPIAPLWQQLASDCSDGLVIAPETDHLLSDLVDSLRSVTVRVLACPPGVIRIASDKLRCARVLRARGVAHPSTWPVAMHDDPACPSSDVVRHDVEPACSSSDGDARLCSGVTANEGPWIVKPRFGCGSDNITHHASRPSLAPGWNHNSDPNRWNGYKWIAQRFCPGKPASISGLIHGNQVTWLPAAEQLLSSSGFEYQGGSAPLDDEHQHRAERLAQDAFQALFDQCTGDATSGRSCHHGEMTDATGGGWIGVDLVLGQSADQDVVIEINPRLTTSYVGLRCLMKHNLFAAMLGIDNPTLQPIAKARQVHWDSSGQVNILR